MKIVVARLHGHLEDNCAPPRRPSEDLSDGHLQRRRIIARAREGRIRERPHHRETVRIDIEEDALVHREPVAPRQSHRLTD